MCCPEPLLLEALGSLSLFAQLQGNLTLECQRAGLSWMRTKSVSFQGISVLKTVLCSISSRELLEAAAFLRPAFRWGFLLNSSGYPLKGEHAVLCLLGCWAWLSKMYVICDLKNLITVCFFFQPVEIHRNGISLLKEGSCFAWVGVCGDAGFLFTVVVTILCSVSIVFFSSPLWTNMQYFFSKLGQSL